MRKQNHGGASWKVLSATDPNSCLYKHIKPSRKGEAQIEAAPPGCTPRPSHHTHLCHARQGYAVTPPSGRKTPTPTRKRCLHAEPVYHHVHGQLPLSPSKKLTAPASSSFHRRVTSRRRRYAGVLLSSTRPSKLRLQHTQLC
jgi:hypothetical protein